MSIFDFMPFAMYVPVIIIGVVAVIAALVIGYVEVSARPVARKASAQIIYFPARRTSLRSERAWRVSHGA